MTALSDLIARLEAATEGGRELDYEILTTVYLPTITEWNGSKITGWWRDHNGISLGCNTEDGWRHEKVIAISSFTSSLDAALTIKPDSCPWWRVGKVQDEHSPLRAFGHGKCFTAEVGLNWGDTPKLGHADTAPLALCIAALGHADTAPLALCIAALKAREVAR